MSVNRRIVLSAAVGLLSFYIAIRAFAQTSAPVDFEKDVQPIFTANCAVAGCHAGTRASAALRLDAGFSYDSLLSPSSPFSPRVIPKDPDKSLLVQRIEGTFPPQMPQGRPPLSQAQISLIRRWISEGALRAAATAALASDFDGNKKVDLDDFFLFAAAFGKRQGEAGFETKFDLNKNGTVDFDDFFIFAADFGKSA
jgi:hypothetical protein